MGNAEHQQKRQVARGCVGLLNRVSSHRLVSLVDSFERTTHFTSRLKDLRIDNGDFRQMSLRFTFWMISLWLCGAS